MFSKFAIKLSGKYKNWGLEPLACNGISKDHRPDLKQLVLGLNICGDGAIPLSHDVHSGNRTDDTTHISNWDQIRRLLQTNDFMYTADSKLCTEKNLAHIEFYNGQYITVMPRTWKEDKLFRKEVIDGNVSWKLILSRPSNRHPNTVIDPTTQSIVRVFAPVEKYELLDRDGQGVEYFPPNLSPLQKQILELMEVPIGLFA